MERLGQSSRVNGNSHRSTTSTAFKAKVSGSNGQPGLADRQLMKDSYNEEEYCCDKIDWALKLEKISTYD